MAPESHTGDPGRETDRAGPAASTSASTDKRNGARQRQAALLATGPRLGVPPATARPTLSRRAGFTRLSPKAAVGDTIRSTDAARPFRSVASTVVLRPELIRRGLHLQAESGLLSGIGPALR